MSQKAKVKGRVSGAASFFAALAFAAAFFGRATFAQDAPPSDLQTARPSDPGIAAPFLWKIESPGAKPSYLFGTIHLTRPSVTNLPLSVLLAIRQADSVYTEIPMDTATLLRMSTEMLLPNGESLTDILPPDLVEDIKKTLDQINPTLTFEPLSRFKIWAFAASLVSLEDQFEHPGAIVQDMLIFQRAAMAGKETGGVETPEEQLAIFDDLSRPEQIAMLREGLEQMRERDESGRTAADQLIEAYLSGDLDALGKKMDEWMEMDDSELTAKLSSRLLTDRNLAMARRMAEKIRAHPGKSTFFAVGAAHLYGPNGLLTLLEKEGFQLQRVQ